MPARLVLLSLVLAGCTVAGARRGDTVILASGADLESVNPLVTTHPLAKQIQRYVLLTTLVRYDSALHPEPYLARRWEWSRDRTQLRMHLTGALRWQDGRPTTAADAAWTLEAARDPATGYPRLRDLESLARVSAPDDTTLDLTFTGPMTRIPDVLTDLAILPRHLLGSVRHDELRRAAWNERPIGNGPFRFVTHEPGRRWVFAADSGFPAELGRPTISRLVVAVVDEPTTKLAALTSGELDFAGIQPAHVDFVRRDPRLTVLDYPLLQSSVVVFNARRPPFDRLATRRAVSLAIDRGAIVSGYLFGFATPAGAPLPDTTPPLFAPGRGRALLGSTPMHFELLTVGSGEAAMEQMIQQQLARIGVTVTIRQLELSAFLERLRGRAHDFDAAILGVSGALDPGYLRSLLDLTGVTIPGGNGALVRGFADSMPVAFLYHARGIQGMNRRMQGVRMDLRGELAGLGAWRAR